MRELGLIDDRAFSFERAQRLCEQGYGPPAIAAKLHQAGFLPATIQEVIAEATSGQDALAAAEGALLARFPQPPRSDRERQRAQQYLSRRGWGSVSWEAIRKWEKDALDEQSDETPSDDAGEGGLAPDLNSNTPDLTSILLLVARREPDRINNPSSQRRAYALCRRRGIDHNLALRIARGDDLE